MQLSPWQHDPSWVLHLYTSLVAQDQSRVTSEPTSYLTLPLCALQLLERALLESSMKGNTRQWQRTFHFISPHEKPSCTDISTPMFVEGGRKRLKPGTL